MTKTRKLLTELAEAAKRPGLLPPATLGKLFASAVAASLATLDQAEAIAAKAEGLAAELERLRARLAELEGGPPAAGGGTPAVAADDERLLLP